MLHEWVGECYRLIQGPPAFQVYGRGRSESRYSIIDIYATSRRDFGSGVPLMDGVCITWTSQIISVGEDFAEALLREQFDTPASPTYPIEVRAGRLSDSARRAQVGAPRWVSRSEIMAHECGHTAQARRMGGLYWLFGAALTLCREGPHWWNAFENHASEQGLFGGIVPGSLQPAWLPRLRRA